jgi:uncharacterized integral membrane protein
MLLSETIKLIIVITIIIMFNKTILKINYLLQQWDLNLLRYLIKIHLT